MIPLRALRFLNYRMFFISLALMGIGLTFIFSTTHDAGVDAFMSRQMIWIAVGFILAWIIMNMDFRMLGSMAYIYYIFSLIVLGIVLFMGQIHKGAQSWLELGPFRVQPGEIAKLGVILCLARFLSEHAESCKRLWFVGVALCLVGLPMGLIIIQPDLGTALVLVPVTFGMLFSAGAKLRHLMTIILMGVASLPIGYSLLHDYQRQRLLVFINPNLDPLGAGYNAIQSKIAVGSGGLFGKGLLQGTQSQLHFLPERHTDFIFSVVGEEWGFIGCFLVLFLYLLFIMGGLRIAGESNDLFGRYLAVGAVLLIAAHVVINTGMTVGVMPITGIPLPFMSYGGSHLITVLACLGLLENIHLRKTMF